MTERRNFKHLDGWTGDSRGQNWKHPGRCREVDCVAEERVDIITHIPRDLEELTPPLYEVVGRVSQQPQGREMAPTWAIQYSPVLVTGRCEPSSSKMRWSSVVLGTQNSSTQKNQGQFLIWDSECPPVSAGSNWIPLSLIWVVWLTQLLQVSNFNSMQINECLSGAYYVHRDRARESRKCLFCLLGLMI